jgi:hypothetical protein
MYQKIKDSYAKKNSPFPILSAVNLCAVYSAPLARLRDAHARSFPPHSALPLLSRLATLASSRKLHFCSGRRGACLTIKFWLGLLSKFRFGQRTTTR